MAFVENPYGPYTYDDDLYEETESEPVCHPTPGMFDPIEAPMDPTTHNPYPDGDAVPSHVISLDFDDWIHETPSTPDPVFEGTTRERPKTPVSPDGQNRPSHPTPKDPSAPGKGKRFRPDQVEILRRFYTKQGDSPDRQSKKDLATATGLAEKQVTGWFNNERRKSRKANNPRPLRVPSSSLTENSPASVTSPSFRGSNNYFGAGLADLHRTRTPHRERRAETNHPTERHGHSMFGLNTPPSESGEVLTSSHSNSPMLSLPFVQSVRPIQRRSGRHSKIEGRFHCTFCSDASSKTAHEWAKHENTHLATEIWTCKLCVSQAPKRSGRKDHFVQHLWQVHRSGYVPESMDQWCSKTDNIRSCCGFCSAELKTWTERKSHIGGHFREGRTMAEWTGDWGLDRESYLRLENANLPEFWPNRVRCS